MTLSKRDVIDKLRAGWRASGDYEKLEDFDLVGPDYNRATPRLLASAAVIRQLVRDGVLQQAGGRPW
jgi:hypothetical protein